MTESRPPEHPDPAPSALVRAAQARLLARIEAGADEAPSRPIDDRYEFGATFAVGGLGVIRRAFDRRLGRTVAIKMLQRSDAAAIRRFAIEAKITARLQHPGIVPLHDIGRTPEGEPYYCMKLIEGRSLDRVIAGEPTLRGRLRLVEHVLAAADAIAYAHQHGVLHRDIKPANILVGPHGETVVIDWGLAKDTRGAIEVEAHDDPSDDGDPTLTGAGTIVGTLRYMPPEQARGQPVDARSDVFALGAVLFHVLAGRPPHARLERALLLDRLLAGEIEDLRPLAAEAPRELVAIAHKAMSSRPGERYAGAGALAEDLRRFLAGRLVDAHRYQPGELVKLWLRRHRVAAAAASAAVVAGAIAWGIYLRGIQAAQVAADEARARAEVAEREALARADAALLAQARGVLGEDPAQALRVLAQVEVDDADELRRTRSIAQAAVARGAPERVLRGHAHAIASVAPLTDGGLVSIDVSGAVWRWNLGTGRGEQVIDLQGPSGRVVAAADAPVWAAITGRHGVVFRGDEPPEAIEVAALPVANGLFYETHRFGLSRGGETLAALGHAVLSGRGLAAAYAWDLRARPAEFRTLPFDHVGRAALSPDGRTIAVTDARRHAVLVAGAEQTRLPDLVNPLAFSPSGLYLAGNQKAIRLADRSLRALDGRMMALTRDDQALVNQRVPDRPPGWDEPQLALIDLASGAARWTSALSNSSEIRAALNPDNGGFVAAERGDRFALRHDGRWTLWSMATGRIVRVLDVGRRGLGVFAADGGFVATHDHDLWWWPPEPLPDVYTDAIVSAAEDGGHALAIRPGRLQEPWRLRVADGAVTPIRCPVAINWKYRRDDPPPWHAIDAQGRVLALGLDGEVCLVEVDGRARRIAVDGAPVTVALADRSRSFALGLADGGVLLFAGEAAPSRWQTHGAVERLWLLPAGGDAIALSATGEVFALHVGEDQPIALGGGADAIARGVKPRVAIGPNGTDAVLAIAGEPGLTFYDDGVALARPMALELLPQLAISPGGRVAVTVPGPAVRLLAGPEDEGREIAVPAKVRVMSFAAEDVLAIDGADEELIRVDVALGEAIVLQRDPAAKALGLALLARWGPLYPLQGTPAGRIEDVPRDRDGLMAWLTARGG